MKPDVKVNLRLTKENHDFIAKVYMWKIKCKSKSMALEVIINKAIDKLRTS